MHLDEYQYIVRVLSPSKEQNSERITAEIITLCCDIRCINDQEITKSGRYATDKCSKWNIDTAYVIYCFDRLCYSHL